MSKQDDSKKPTHSAAFNGKTGQPAQKKPSDALLDAAIRAGVNSASPKPLSQFRPTPQAASSTKPLMQAQDNLAHLQQELDETKAAMDQAIEIINELQNQTLTPEESAKRLAELRKRLT